MILLSYDELKNQYSELIIEEMDLSKVNGLKGLYYNGRIAINEKMTDTEKSCVLAEEIGHHYTTCGNILDQQNIQNRKQERRARLWAYNKLLKLSDIINAYNYGCENIYEAANFLNVSEDFLREAIKAYRSKYGSYVRVDEYIITFEPNLTVIKNIK